MSAAEDEGRAHCVMGRGGMGQLIIFSRRWRRHARLSRLHICSHNTQRVHAPHSSLTTESQIGPPFVQSEILAIKALCNPTGIPGYHHSASVTLIDRF
jgi:hypothetical protein